MINNIEIDDIVNAVSLGRLLLFILISSASFFTYKLIIKLARKYEEQHSHGQTTTLVHVISRILAYVVLIVGGLLILNNFGIDVSGIAAGLGLVSAIVALALQDFAKDVIMGLHIITDKFFSIGDGVKYQDQIGVISEFSMQTTKIRLADGSVISVCNRDITQITHLSHEFYLDVPLSYSEDIRKVHSVLQRCSERIAEVGGIEGCTYCGTQDFSDSAIIYRLLIYSPVDGRPDLRRAALRIIQEELEHEHIAIPYNQLDVNLRSRTV